MPLPAYEKNELLQEGYYSFRFSEEPEVRKNEKGKIFIILKLVAKDRSGAERSYRDLIAPWEDRYHELLLALGAIPDEKGRVHLGNMPVTGKFFAAKIVHQPDVKDPTKIRDRLSDIVAADFMPGDQGPGDDDIPF